MQYARVSPLWFGFSFGVVWAFGLLVMALSAHFIGFGLAMVRGIATVYIGYGPSFGGAVIGMLYGFFDVGVAMALVALIYNTCLMKQQNRGV